MSIHILPAFDDNYIFALVYKDTALVVDPGDPVVVEKFLDEQDLVLTTILQTHHHWDHTDGTSTLKNRYPDAAVYTPYFQKGRYPVSTHMVKEGDEVTFGGWTFSVMKTPGHTFDHISYFDVNRKILFCGDTLFNIGCGRIFDGSFEGLFLSLQKLKTLPDDVQVYCTHEYTLENIKFAKTVSDDAALIAFEEECKTKRKEGLFTIPFDLGTNKKLNPFLLARNVENFSELRTRKDRF